MAISGNTRTSRLRTSSTVAGFMGTRKSISGRFTSTTRLSCSTTTANNGAIGRQRYHQLFESHSLPSTSQLGGSTYDRNSKLWRKGASRSGGEIVAEISAAEG